MKITVAGLGLTGKALTDVLKSDGHSVTVIDTDRAAVAAAEAQLGVTGVVGNSAMTDILLSVGADRADLFIAATNSDERNILSCISARSIGARHTVAVVHSAEISSEAHRFSEICGIDLIFNPEYETAHEIYRAIRIPSAVNAVSFAGGRAELVHISVKDSSQIIGKTLAAIRMSSKLSVLVCAVKRAGHVIIPDGRFSIESGDELYITGPHEDIYSFLKMMGMPDYKIKSIMIIGAGRVAVFLASMLEKSGISVKLIEKSEKRCNEIRAQLPKTRVINGNPFEGSLLAEHGIAAADAVMALSDKDEDNAILAMYAKQSNSKKIITKLSKGPLTSMLPDMGYNSTIISVEKTLSRIALSHVRALSENLSSSVGTVCKIADGSAEIVEFIVKPGFAYSGIPLMKLNIRSGLLIAGIIRKKEVLYPNGMTSVLEGDRVIIVSAKKTVRSLNEIIE